ncbi:unnamed protein product, partial [Ectocarpus sp. 12 AP-2014]
AKPLNADLVEKFPEKFGAVLGYANTLSNLKEYKSALSWVEKAIALQPENESAKISRKFMRLGYANSFVNNQQYKQGEQTLKKIFEDFPNDKDVLLNLANLYLIIKQGDKAKNMYALYATNQKDSITALNGIALAEHINENDKEALRISKTATVKVDQIDDVPLTESTYDRYVQALIWNRKFI